MSGGVGPLSLDTIDPRFCTVQEWTDSMVFPLIDKSKTPRLDNPDAWKEWAMHVIQSGRIARYNPPDPRFFDDWREWAFRFTQVLS